MRQERRASIINRENLIISIFLLYHLVMKTMNRSFLPKSLTKESFLEGLSVLAEVDTDLARIISAIGPPPLWSREPGFSTMIHIILEQQVSLASAQAAFTKLNASVSELTPERFVEFTDESLKEFGFSRQKTTYCRGLAQAILQGELDLEELSRLDDTSARNKLTELKGIGPWTADIYLLMALLRPDIWPSGDLALIKAIESIKKLPSKPTQETISEVAAQWIPWRAVAARVLWHYYLS